MGKRKPASTPLPDRTDGTGLQHDKEDKNPCVGCDYHGGYNRYSACCNYYLITGHRRPCPAGAGCTVRSATGNKQRCKSVWQ